MIWFDGVDDVRADGEAINQRILRVSQFKSKFEVVLASCRRSCLLMAMVTVDSLISQNDLKPIMTSNIDVAYIIEWNSPAWHFSFRRASVAECISSVLDSYSVTQLVARWAHRLWIYMKNDWFASSSSRQIHPYTLSANSDKILATTCSVPSNDMDWWHWLAVRCPHGDRDFPQPALNVPQITQSNIH